ncbi:cellulose synthase [Shinella pollutisoli]|uniref:Cellulose synthase n=1 Tax=Shinella pollutisoli TaxID=2250594 RepID=A0ABV7DIM1_9HYPH|nr:cellulose synthase [Shinella pollutisoli]
MKSILMAFALLSAGAAGVAGVSLGVPEGMPRFADLRAFDGIALPERGGRVGTAAKRPRMLEVAQADAVPEERRAGPVVDESALRYFAARGDTARLNAEIARLRALYPTWTPPENPLAIPENEDRELEAMWSLYSQSRLADVRAAIARRQAEDPQWTPPADLVERLDVAEKRARLIAASNAGQDEEVVRLGAETPSLLTCSDADVLWRVAESFARTDRTQRAKDAYTYMLTNCADAPIRLATVQKASTVLGYADMQDVLAHERSNADGTREFDPIRNDLARRFVGAADADATITVAPAWLTIVEKLTTTEGLASDALLLGWYHLRRDDNAAAEPFFRKARTIEDSASASQGLALILLARKMPAEAEAIMYPWRTSSGEAMNTYLAATTNLLALDPPQRLDADVLGRIARVTVEQRHPETAEQFGWYALAADQPATAEEWFDQALRWKADYEPAAYGLAVARLRLEDGAGVAAVQRAWAGRSERIARLGERDGERDERTRAAATETLRKSDRRRPVRQRQTADEPAAVVTAVRVSGSAGCRTTRNPARMPAASALSLGWCLMDVNRPLEAAQAFEVALSGSGRTRSDAAYGQSLAYLRAGLTSDAAVAATRAELDGSRAAELQAAILSDRAVGSFRAKRYRETLVFLDQRTRYRPEPTDLMVLRAYSLKNLGRRADALRLFEALAETGNREAIRAFADMRTESGRP